MERTAAKALRTRAARLLPWVDTCLRKVYRTAPLGNKRNALNELIYIQLSVRTREGAYQSTYHALRRQVNGQWARLQSLPDDRIEQQIAIGGMARVKMRRIREILNRVTERFGRVTLAPLRSMTNTEAERFLCSLPGVGHKVARCVLLYSLDRDVFPVDSHCRRILERLGLMPPGFDRKTDYDAIQSLVAPALRHTLHVNMVHHGRAICTPVTPRCGDCPLLKRCAQGRANLTGQAR